MGRGVTELIKTRDCFSFYSQRGVPVAAPSILGEISHTHFRIHISGYTLYIELTKQLPEVLKYF